MALFPICYKTPCQDNTNSIFQSNFAEYHVVPKAFTCKAVSGRTPASLHSAIKLHISWSGLHRERSSKAKVGKTHIGCVPESRISDVHRNYLESYLKKLRTEVAECSSNSAKDIEKVADGSRAPREGLESLDEYFDAFSKDASAANDVISSPGRETTGFVPESSLQNTKSGQVWRGKIFRGLGRRAGEISAENSSMLDLQDDSSNLYFVGALTSINIAVFIFEVASPIANDDYGLYSLPSLYGAKVNELILIGEWWRLITPMFLHAGLLHVGLSCWVLLTLGSQVCKVYGWFTFFLVYILGGISGNSISFLHTPDPTIGGSGPAFAIIGAWLIYQLQNKDVVSHEVSEKLFFTSVIATAAIFPLGSFGPIDYWTHVAAVITGIAYGFFTCPMLQMDDALSSKASKKEGITVISKHVSPCRSVTIFTVFVLAVVSLVFFCEPPPNTLYLEGILEISD